MYLIVPIDSTVIIAVESDVWDSCLRHEITIAMRKRMYKPLFLLPKGKRPQTSLSSACSIMQDT